MRWKVRLSRHTKKGYLQKNIEGLAVHEMDHFLTFLIVIHQKNYGEEQKM